MANNPTCRFLIFPQTVFYQSQENLKRDADFFAQFDCTICARSLASYDLLRANFKNEVLLVPDMAFCINMDKWRSGVEQCGRPLLLFRQDAEQKLSPSLESLPREGLDVDDWWPMCHDHREFHLGRRLRKRLPHACCFNLTRWICDAWHTSVYRPFLIRKGVEQLEAHTDIYTTRLHGCILSLLLGKEKIVFFDNSYGKNRDFYETWLRDCSAIEFRA